MSGSGPSELDAALAATAAGEATGPARSPGVEYHRLKARTRELLFGVAVDPPRIGRFAVLRRIGEGGMGVVYSAYDDELERKVAIKLVRPELAIDDAQLRIRREAQAAARLSHPNVVAVYEIGEHHGRLFVAMEFVRGQTLRQWLRAAPRSWQSIVDVFIEAGHGLHAAHAAGLVHRDFKPDNVMIGDEPAGARGHGRVRVLDFGVARRVLGAAAASDAAATDVRPSLSRARSPDAPGPTEPGTPTALTGVGAIIGTPAYMAPEQLAGELADARSDQYALCLSMWMALCDGDPPGRASGASQPPVSGTAARLPARVRRVLERGLSPRREDRHPSVEVLTNALARARHRPRRWGVVLAVTGVIGVGAALWSTRAPSDCVAATAELGAVWSDARRDRMRAEVRTAARPGAAAPWLELEPELDGFAHAWRDAHAQVCDANVLTGDPDTRLQQRRCLAARLAELRSRVASLADADAATLQAALAEVRGWDPPAACLDPEQLQRWAEREAWLDAPPPPGSASGLVSDFESDLGAQFGFGWVKSTDQLIDGTSDVVIVHGAPGAHGSARSLAITGHVHASERPRWSGAMYFPGPQPMAAANLTSLPQLSFAVRGTPGPYEVVLFNQSQAWGEAAIAFEVEASWRDIHVDLRELGVPLYDVTGIFIGRSSVGTFECLIDDVRLDAALRE